MLGLFAFFYGFLHFMTWFWLDKFFDPQDLWTDIVKRPFHYRRASRASF